MDNIVIQTELFIEDIGKKINKMDLEMSNGLMVHVIKVSIDKEKNMEKVGLCGWIALFIKGSS